MRSIAYLTDVEGLWPKLLDFLDRNPHVALDDGGRLVVADGATLVFGGDAIDRGPHARRIVALLLEAHRRQPDRVVLLAGNRDINKLRLPRELAGFPPTKAPPEVRTAPRPELLRWIFEHTMGARQAFASRQQELAREGVDAGDEAVVRSFLDDLEAEGDLRAYLASCRLAFRDGPNLFVHGAVTAQNLGHVPDGQPPTDPADVDAWVARLNAWYAAQIDHFVRDEYDPAGTPRWAPIVAYQAPLPGTRLNQTSIVYGRPTDDDGNPLLPEPHVVEALERAGIRRLVVGHTPVGDSAALVRGERFELVVADNSYSHCEHFGALFVRGEHLSFRGRVRLEGAAEPLEVRFASTLQGPDEGPIGLRLASSGHLVKGELATGDLLLWRSHPNYRFDQRAASPRDVAAAQPQPPERPLST
jgi:hypothetical protein